MKSLKFVLNPNTGIGEIHGVNVNVEPFIRNMDITSRVSDVASIKEVREFNVAEQQKMGEEKGICNGWQRYWYSCFSRC